MAAKKVKVSNVPNLRFPGFEGEEHNPYKKYFFKDIFLFSTGRNIKQDQASPEFEIPCVRYGELYYMYSEVINEVINRTNLDKSELLFSKGDEVLLPSAGEDPLDIGLASALTIENVAIGRTINILRPINANVYSQIYVSYYINQKLRKKISTLAKGSSISNVYNSDLKTLEIVLPNLDEQTKIASFLSLIDARIQTQSKIIQRLKSLIKATIQILVKGNRPNWKKQYLNEILTEREETNIDNNTIHSVSVSKGVVNQIEYLGRSFAAKDTSNYNVVCYGDIIYTKSPTGSFPYGIIKQSYIPYKVAVSPLYGVFIPKNVHLATILHHYFDNPVNTSNYLYSLVQKGAKNTINITNQNFLNKQIFLPTDEKEIALMANLLHNIMDKINLEQSLINKLSDQKKYLLQHLFI